MRHELWFMAHPSKLLSVSEALLKDPAKLLPTAEPVSFFRLTSQLFLITALGFGVSGLVIGGFSGEGPIYYAPLKILFGGIAAGMLTLPGLYILTNLSGADFSFRNTVVQILITLATIGMVLLALAPIGWIISESTNSQEIFQTLMLFFYTIAVGMGLQRSLRALSKTCERPLYLKLWMVIFVLVSFQMTSSLRPLSGESPFTQPNNHQFFLEHWLDTFKTEDW